MPNHIGVDIGGTKIIAGLVNPQGKVLRHMKMSTEAHKGKDQVIEKPNRVDGLIDVKCDAHYWMRSYIYSSKHPYVAITDDKGDFEIKNLLPGKYKVRFWHEGFEEVVKDIEVKAGSATTADVTFKKAVTPAFMSRINEAG